MTTTLALVMIVKDEAHTIARTIASARPHIDRWLVLDTGSTDRTQDVVRQELAGIPGELHEGPFVDFAQARNLALDLHGTQTTHVIMLDADDELVGGDLLRRELPTARANCILLRLRKGSVGLPVSRVLRTGSGWRYRGRVHEYLYHPTERCALHLLGPSHPLIRHDPGAVGIAKTQARKACDVVWLREMIEEEPNNGRNYYFLGSTYFGLGQDDEARKVLRHRLTMGGCSLELSLAKLMLEDIERRAAGLEGIGLQ